MGTSGIQGILIETHNWGKTVAFWQELGFVLEFETDHNSGQLRHPTGGPYLFVAEHPDSNPPAVAPIVGSDDAALFEPPATGEVDRPFTAQHWNVLEMTLRDPDGRLVSVQAPLPEGVDAPRGHGEG